jgi:hypothetical protein
VSEELFNRFNRALKKKYMMDGRVHFNNKRITMIFENGGGVFSFQLKEAQENVAGRFYGQIGLNKGYILDIDQWLDRSTLTGTWHLEGEKATRKLKGKYNYTECPWNGFVDYETHKSYLSFPNF